ncbi:hypothetical protein [Ferviditalea candida]|uniref:DUF1565 domain-containing protein n=1 Tax=Ferviditalea candida TaxID=3108399 RepID=A0ABU5ZD32_9BACL|nr:hypothetical protein [Paenibacillaceae bacterium T2]
MTLLERIVSNPANVYVANTREDALAAAISGSGTAAIEITRDPTWPTLEQFTNDNSQFLKYNPGPQNPTYVWDHTTSSAQRREFAAATNAYTFQQSTNVTISMAAFADNAMQAQIDLVDASAGTIISSKPLGVLLQGGSMDPVTGVTVEKPQFPYNWQNIRFYSVSTGTIPAGKYQIVFSFSAVNYDQYPGRANPAALSFQADVSAILTGDSIYNPDQNTFYRTINEAVADAAPNETIELLSGTYQQPSELVIDKPLTLRGRSAEQTVVTFDPAVPIGLRLQADDVTVEDMQFIVATESSGDNWALEIPLKAVPAEAPEEYFSNITIQRAVIQGGRRNAEIAAENLTLRDTQFVHRGDLDSVNIRVARGTTAIERNVFNGGELSRAAITVGDSEQYLTTGRLRVDGNLARSHAEFTRFDLSRFRDIEELAVINNTVEYVPQEVPTSSAVTLMPPLESLGFEQLPAIQFEQNTIDNPNPGENLAVYLDYLQGGIAVPAEGQIKVYDNVFNIPRPWGVEGDTVSEIAPVGFSPEAPQGISLAVFDLKGNIVPPEIPPVQ